MGKIIGGVVAGYVTMVVLVFALFSLTWLVLGAGGAFQPESWDPSLIWVLVTIVLGLAAAIGGGYVAVAIAHDERVVIWLIVVVLIIGLLSAVMMMFEPDAGLGVRPESVSMFEAMGNARQPVWVAFLNPVLGVVGVLMGARMRGSPTSSP